MKLHHHRFVADLIHKGLDMLDDAIHNKQEHRQWWCGDRTQMSASGNVRIKTGDWQSKAEMKKKGPSAIHRAHEVRWTWESE